MPSIRYDLQPDTTSCKVSDRTQKEQLDEIFTQDVNFSATYIAINMYPVKINDCKPINKIQNGFLKIKTIHYMFFKYQEAISLTTLDRQVIVGFNAYRPKAGLANL